MRPASQHRGNSATMSEQDNATTHPGLRILILEDDAAARHAMEWLFKVRGHEVASAASAAEAEAMSAKLVPDVLISDWQLEGDRDGLDVAANLSRRYPLKVIMITAHHLERLRQKAAQSRVRISACRRKPVSIRELAELAESLA